MKNRTAFPRDFDIVRSLAEFARSSGLALNDAKMPAEFLAYVGKVIATTGKRPTVVHGMRAQTMFAYVAAGLGQCVSISEEDAGEFLSRDPAITRPDYRIVTTDGLQFLVEVKNFYQRNPRAKFIVKRDYVDRLQAYADLCRTPLKLAIYWTRWNIWTLLAPSALTQGKDRLSIEMGDAIMHNEMSTLGDRMLGIESPLAFRVYSDPQHPRHIGSDGSVQASIDRVVLCVAGREILDPIERRLALFLLFYADWARVQHPAHDDDNDLIAMEVQVSTEERSGPDFDMIGTISSMASRKYRHETSRNNEVSHLRPSTDPAALVPIIPDDYVGTVLKLWRVQVQPKA